MLILNEEFPNPLVNDFKELLNTYLNKTNHNKWSDFFVKIFSSYSCDNNPSDILVWIFKKLKNSFFNRFIYILLFYII